jgi:hypothetical protein
MGFSKRRWAVSEEIVLKREVSDYYLVFNGTFPELIGSFKELLRGNLDCETIASKFVYDNFKERKKYKAKCCLCGNTASRGYYHDGKNACRKCLQKLF